MSFSYYAQKSILFYSKILKIWIKITHKCTHITYMHVEILMYSCEFLNEKKKGQKKLENVQLKNMFDNIFFFLLYINVFFML